jgi:predicted MFS family arabinose efflux permease
MIDSISPLNFLIPLLIVLLLNWLFLQASSKPLHKLNKSTRKQLRKISISTWHRIWASTALVTGSTAIFVFLHLLLFHLVKLGSSNISQVLSYLPGIAIGILVLASGHASLIYCNIDALISLLSEDTAKNRNSQNPGGRKTEKNGPKEKSLSTDFKL